MPAPFQHQMISAKSNTVTTKRYHKLFGPINVSQIWLHGSDFYVCASANRTCSHATCRETPMQPTSHVDETVYHYVIQHNI